MRITDLIPWRRKSKRTNVPVKVKDHPAPVFDRASRWTGLAPFGAFGGWPDAFGPRMDMVEHDDRFNVVFEVPGMPPDDLEVTLSGRSLTVRGQKGEKEPRPQRSSYALCRTQGAFCRSVVIPARVSTDHVEASLKDGVLTIELPKADEGRKRKRIPVRTG